ncbi:ER membrane protein complex subunit 2-like [Anneissia japonica]|uniref:ER membrane protein complex subunit 2-like n=1 Tax=Anneissia japonica TaxID=1529436 RepID=UPI001425B782|nr:ER membrane protein complex subunit 2-like [Anneissia japonica]
MATAMKPLSWSWTDLRDKLRKWREENSRESEAIVHHGEILIAHHKNKIGDEIWPVYEQVCIAALDCGRNDLANRCISELTLQFPDSARARRLQGMQLEAQERYKEALHLYDDLLKKDESNAQIRKRKIAITLAQGCRDEAIKELNTHLKQFMGDQEAWKELADLYIVEQHYEKAVFCYEELILSNPHNHLYHQRYAELKYTQGGTENMETARKYFAQTLKLNAKNMRALYGFYLAASNLSLAPKAKQKEENKRYADWAHQQICQRYKEVQDEQMEEDQQLMKQMMLALDITTANQ